MCLREHSRICATTGLHTCTFTALAIVRQSDALEGSSQRAEVARMFRRQRAPVLATIEKTLAAKEHR